MSIALDRNMLDALNKAGDALKAAGEPYISLGYHPAGPLFVQDGYSIRLECPGVTMGIHGSGSTPEEAYMDACAKRAAAIAEQEEREAFEAEYRARRARMAA